MDSSVPFGGLWSSRSRRKKSSFARKTAPLPPLVTSVAEVTLNERVAPWVERYSPKHVTTQSRALGTKLMRSEKWFPFGESKTRRRGLPYIMKSGHISGSVYLTWRCSSVQWFSTVVTSVFEKLKKRTIVTRRSKYKKYHHLAEIAILYTLTMDDQLLERLLNCQRVGFRKLLFYHINRLDAKTRFLFDQACQSALWFQLRGYPRVKSNEYKISTIYTPGECGLSRSTRMMLDALCDPWIVEGSHACTKGGCFLYPRV